MNLSNDFFELYGVIWYKHPVLRDYCCSYNGEVLYKNKNIIKPRLFNNELHIIISLIKLKFYPLKRLVYECINNIPEAPFIMHLDGNVKNNCINNLGLLHIKSYD